MKNEDFQKTILNELKNVIEQLDELKIGQRQLGMRQDEMYQDLSTKQDIMYKALSIRQDEMYQVLRSIEHSNNAGKAELDSHNLRVSKIEGKLKKVSKAWQEDVEVSNL